MEAREEGDWDEGRSKKSSLSSPFFGDSKLYPCQDWEYAGWAKLDIILFVQTMSGDSGTISLHEIVWLSLHHHSAHVQILSGED